MLDDFKISLDATGKPLVLFPITFETEHHAISYSTFERCCTGVLSTFQSADYALFGELYHTELVLGTFEQGSVVGWFGRAFKHVAYGSGLWAASQFGDGFLQGLTGKTFTEWGEYSADFLVEKYDEASEFNFSSDVLAPLFASTDACTKLLSMNEEEFESIISERPDAADLASDGRMTFYEACRIDSSIPSVRFAGGGSGTVVRRSDFSNRGRRTRVDQLGPNPNFGTWKKTVLELEVTSPTWDPRDQQRGWKGRLPNGKFIYFQIEDGNFWKMVFDRELKTASPDYMKAQFLYEDINGRYKNAKAISILEFNNQPISHPIMPSRVEEMLKELNSNLRNQSELFRIKKSPT